MPHFDLFDDGLRFSAAEVVLPVSSVVVVAMGVGGSCLHAVVILFGSHFVYPLRHVVVFFVFLL